MTKRPALTLAGADVGLHQRLPDGRVVIVYLDRTGTATPHTRIAHAHELRGIGWHLAAIKAAITRLPLAREAAPPHPETPAPAARPSAWLHVHHTAAED